MSKLAGELAAKMTSSTILRTNFVGKARAHIEEVLHWLYNSLKEEKQIKFLQTFYLALYLLQLFAKQ